MGHQMNCFEWQNRASDYLDGTLLGPEKQGADEHVESCKDCSEQSKHYRMILTSIAAQPRSALPVPIRRAPFAVALPRLDMGRLSRSRWEQIPWWLRTTIEGTSIVFLILLGISAGPKVRALYERNIERNLSEFNEAFNHIDPSIDPAAFNMPLGRGKPAAGGPSDTQSLAGGAAQGGDEFASEGGENDDEDSADEGSGMTEETDGDVRVANNEIWRFNLKTDSPHEIRPRVVQILTDLKIPATTRGLGGIEAPGGIQFDLILPQAVLNSLKKQLQKLEQAPPEGTTGSNMGGTFTWYKNKSKQSIASGQTHVVIWLSQM